MATEAGGAGGAGLACGTSGTCRAGAFMLTCLKLYIV
jgi:hypothetical protein